MWSVDREMHMHGMPDRRGPSIVYEWNRMCVRVTGTSLHPTLNMESMSEPVVIFFLKHFLVIQYF